MDRQMVYSGQIPLETDLLNTNKNAMVALGKLAGAIFGSNTYANGLSVGANSPAALNVVVQPGEIYSLQNIDGTPYSSLPADTAHQIVKQGILLDAVTLSTPAPGSAGQSINYLIQATFAEVDGGTTVLPYYNASNPAQAYSGPSNSGSTSYTKRQGTVVLSAKAGTAAATGSQTTPSPDSGYVGLAVVTVAYGAASVTGSNISAYAGAPYVGNPIATGRLLNLQRFTSNGTYTPTPGTTTVIVEVQGGGGAGGGAQATSSGQVAAGGGGAAGGYAMSRLTSGFSGVPVTVGSGGAPATAAAGGAGQSSSFGAMLSATGGNGGTLGLATSTPTSASMVGGSVGGAGAGGNLVNAAGGLGRYSILSSSPVSGEGGSSKFGAGAYYVSGLSGGNSATTPGAGGSGGCAPSSAGGGAAGGSGAAGVVIIWEYA